VTLSVSGEGPRGPRGGAMVGPPRPRDPLGYQPWCIAEGRGFFSPGCCVELGAVNATRPASGPGGCARPGGGAAAAFLPRTVSWAVRRLASREARRLRRATATATLTFVSTFNLQGFSGHVRSPKTMPKTHTMYYINLVSCTKFSTKF
jgi:hypothetical protein